MASAVHRMMARIVSKGSLKLILASGETHVFGDGSEEMIVVRIADAEAEQAIASDPGLKLAEMYMDGRVILEAGNIFDFLSLVRRNGMKKAATLPIIAREMARIIGTQVRSRLPINRNLQNVSHHYDLSAKLFDLFLDEDWQYSCAYFEPQGISLDEAQLAKKRHIAAKLLLEQGNRVLEIGSGWGGLGLYLAEAAGVDVTGINSRFPATGRPAVALPIAFASNSPTIAIFRVSTTASSRSACSNMSASETTGTSSTRSHAFWTRKASWCCIPSAVPSRTTRPMPLSRNTSSPAAICRRWPKSCRRSRKPAC